MIVYRPVLCFSLPCLILSGLHRPGLVGHWLVGSQLVLPPESTLDL